MADRYIYQVAVEAFFVRAVAGRFDAAAKARLRDAGIVVDEPLLSVYPADVFHRCIAIAAGFLYPDLAADEAQYRAGKDHIDAFVQSYPGKMMAGLARQIDPRMILEYTATFIRLGNNFTESRVRVVGPSQEEVWMNDVGDVPVARRRIKPDQPKGDLGLVFVEGQPEQEPEDYEMKVAMVRARGPAAAAGVVVGDVVVSVDGHDAKGAASHTVWPLLDVPEGTKVTVGLARGDNVRSGRWIARTSSWRGSARSSPKALNSPGQGGTTT